MNAPPGMMAGSRPITEEEPPMPVALRLADAVDDWIGELQSGRGGNPT